MVSIIILNYNTFDLTCRCISSILSEVNHKTEYEIILVDNASTECDPIKFLETFPDIKLIRNIENIGFSKGCNTGIQHAGGEYILLLNSDTLLLNDAISLSFDFLHKNEDTGVLTCRVENPDGSPQNNCQHFPGIRVSLLEGLRLHKLFPARKRGKLLFGPYFSYEEFAYPGWVWGTFFMFPRKILDVFPEKKLPETFWMYGEDMEWCWLIRKAVYKIAFVPDGRIRHYNQSVDSGNSRKKIIASNYMKFVHIYYSRYYRIMFIALCKIMNLLK